MMLRKNMPARKDARRRRALATASMIEAAAIYQKLDKNARNARSRKFGSAGQFQPGIRPRAVDIGADHPWRRRIAPKAAAE